MLESDCVGNPDSHQQHEVEWIHKLYKISAELKIRDINSLKFLLKDLVSSSKLEKTDRGSEIMTLLIDNNKIDLTTGNMDCLQECLYYIGRRDLLRHLNISSRQVMDGLKTKRSTLSNYRLLLHKLSEEIKSDDFKNLKSYVEMSGCTSRGKLDEAETSQQLLMLLEEEGLITENDIKFLKAAFGEILSDCGYLEKLIEEYESINGQILGQSDFETDSGKKINIPSKLTLNIERESYTIDTKPKGYCIIINNAKFLNDCLPVRNGAEEDIRNIQRVFTKLNYAIKLFRDLTASEMEKVLGNIASENHSNFSCLVCFVLSHGTTGHVFGRDRRKLEIMKIPNFFGASKCPSLSGKPKLFFIQACQTEGETALFVRRRNIESDGVEDNIVSDMADILIGYSTVPGLKSFRSRSEGSWYIKQLCVQIARNYDKHDVLQILTNVNREIGKVNAPFENGYYKQTPAPYFTLTKAFFF
ncbi:DgyrCDS4053 [Dimorphilus gyrociliatus]|uniref:DgyrCDS4053 n=1 Tax=Dimorphilus gyrociliatus TaxID=2664684 RepID=A0A7I8VKC7_9ANNE|nr:DgyrCDS4053 [Dimorphilus gyrociliatus]